MPGPGKGHHHPGDLYKDVKWISPEQIGAYLEDVGKELMSSSQLALGNSNQIAQPGAPSEFEVRYEQAPEGEMKLVFEIEWNHPYTNRRSTSRGDINERISNASGAGSGSQGDIDQRTDGESSEE